MLLTIIIVAVVCVVVYLLRRNFRRAWYVLRTGDEHPDWEKLGGAVKGVVRAPNVSE